MRALIVDDDPCAVEALELLCAELSGLQIVGTASNGIAALRLAHVLRPELMFLDALMPELDGIAVARSLREEPHPPAIIFVSHFDQFSLRAFDVGACDYLIKPVSLERLREALSRVHLGERGKSFEMVPPEKAWLSEVWAMDRKHFIRVPVGAIDFIRADRDYMRLHVGSHIYLVKRPLKELERHLDPKAFIRLHRSVIARRAAIICLHHEAQGRWVAQLANGCPLPLGRTYLANVRTMMQYYPPNE